MAQAPPSTAGILMVHDRFQVGKELGKGAFGVLHAGKNLITGEPVAIKFEIRTIPNPQLPLEYTFYKALGSLNTDVKGIPKLFYFADVPNHNAYHVLVMELLGASLDNLFDKVCKRHFKPQIVIQIAEQMIERIKYVHNKGIINRDIKPENWLFGRKGSANEKTLYIIDFGLAKFYMDGEDDEPKTHIKESTSSFVIGTARYCSISAHEYKTLSRRDDLEAIAYVLIYLCKSELPWQGQDGDPVERNRKIGIIKKQTKPETLCDKLPECFLKFLKYSNSSPIMTIASSCLLNVTQAYTKKKIETNFRGTIKNQVSVKKLVPTPDSETAPVLVKCTTSPQQY
jgi:serine/threonine protein kinase